MKQSPPSAFAGATPAPSPFGPAPSVEVRLLHSIPADWGPAWDDLAQHAAEPSFLADRAPVAAAIQHQAGDAPVRMLAIWQGRMLIGLLPVAIASHYGRLPVRHVHNWRHLDHPLGTPLMRAGHEAEIWAAILATLDQAEWAPGFLHLTGLQTNGPIVAGLRATGRPVHMITRADRRPRIVMPLSGLRRTALFHLCRIGRMA